MRVGREGLYGAVMFLLGCFPAGAVYFNPVPHTLTNGTPGASSDVNDNFDALVADGNAAKAAIEASLAALSGAGVPSKGVIMVDVAVCPAGYVIANGAAGTPDLRGVYIRGLDQGAGRDPGRVLGSFQDYQLQTHTHQQPGGNYAAGAFYSSGGYNGIGTVTVTLPVIQNQASGINQVRPSTVVLMFCMRP